MKIFFKKKIFIPLNCFVAFPRQLRVLLNGPKNPFRKMSTQKHSSLTKPCKKLNSEENPHRKHFQAKNDDRVYETSPNEQTIRII